MNATSEIRAHWAMVECLFDEIYLGQHGDTLHEREMIEELFRYFAGHDPRFHAAGLRWNPKGYIEYRGCKAEGAIALFLGLPTTPRGDATHQAVNTLYKTFETTLDFRVWLRWHVQKMYGFTDKRRDLWTDYPRVFPSIVNETNHLEKV
ncbi:hypothetical protein HOV23_gp118 [Pseudomonas phage Lana]|uniref:Uncharacterized protein n=1 Tax=Pseudomonas phage Lana TaxID=2530172 RepID=A0A481W664_9CAUD|nr:hypothetical protein HOV23_gp118 [Pseudomonas phage Lana]QBJ04455.1 hypothetical protein [Pseudomonas phage Lana]